jgi:hypothetical protein
MVEVQVLNNKLEYCKQYVVSHLGHIVIVTTNSKMAFDVEKEIQEKEQYEYHQTKQRH